MASIGIDIISIARIEAFIHRKGDRGLRRFLSPDEMTLYAHKPQKVASVWAAKEAFSKALGCGIGSQCGFLDIVFLHNKRGQPFLRIAPRVMQEFQIKSHSLSVSHDGGFVVAAAIVAYLLD